MKQITLAVALFISLFATLNSAAAQCNGNFGADSACGTVGGGLPGPIPFSSIITGSGQVIGPSTSTIGCLAPWANTTGTLLANNCALSISGSTATYTGIFNIVSAGTGLNTTQITTPTTYPTSIFLNPINVVLGNVQMTGSPGSSNITGIGPNCTVNGASYQGQLFCLGSVLVVTEFGTPGYPYDQFVASYSQITGAQNTTDNDAGVFAGNDDAYVTGTGWSWLVGREIDVSAVQAPVNKEALRIVQSPSDAYQGTSKDAGILYYNAATVGWKNAIEFDESGGPIVSSTGCFICNVGTISAGKGIDFTGVTFSGNAFTTTGNIAVGVLVAGSLGSGFTPVTGPLGGTGLTTAAIGDLMYASATTPTWSRLADVAVGSVLISGGVSTPPSWATTLPATVQGNITATGTIGTGVWQGTLVGLAYGGTAANLTANAGGVVYSTSSALAILVNPNSNGECLLSGTSAPTWGSCSGSTGVASLGNASADTSLTIAGTGSGPWTGTVTAKLNLGNAQTWTALQTFNTGELAINGGSATAGVATVNSSGVVTSAAVATTAQIWAATAGDILDAGNVFNAAGALVALTGTTSVTPNFSNGFNFSFTATTADNFTLQNPSNIKAGQTGVIQFTQPASGTVVTAAFGSDWQFAGGVTPALTATLGAVDDLFYWCPTTSVCVAFMANNVKT